MLEVLRRRVNRALRWTAPLHPVHYPRHTGPEDAIIESPAAGSPAANTSFFARHGTALALSLAALYTAVFSSASILKYRDYLYDDFDLAIFVQALSGILRGTLFSSIRGMSWLGDHSSLILFLLAPIFAVFRHPVTLLVIQSAALGLGALPVFWLARRELGDARTALACAALYLLHPALGYANLYEFHPEALSTPLLLFAFLFLRERRLGPMVLCTALALLGREDVALVVAALGLYAFLLDRPARWAFAAALIGLAAASLALSFGLLKPALNTGQVDFSLAYPDWGLSPAGILEGLVRHPLRAFGWLFATPGDLADTGLKQTWYLWMLLPLLWLPLLSPWTLLIAAPIVIELFLSRGHAQHTIFYHYTLLVTPFFAAAAVLGLKRLRGRTALRSIAGTVPALALIAALGSNLAFGPFARALTHGETPQPLRPTAMDRTLRPYRDRLMARLPARGGMVASFEFLARLARRDSLHSLHHILCGHYTISRLPYPTPRGVGGLIAGLDPEHTLASVDMGTGQRLRDLIAVNGLQVAAAPGTLVLYLGSPARAADSIETWCAGTFPIPAPSHRVFDHELTFLGSDLGPARAAPGELLPVRTYWERVAPADRIFMTLFVLLDQRGEPACQTSVFLGSLVNPVHLWPAGTMVRATDRIVLPGQLKPGRYTLALEIGAWQHGAVQRSESDAAGSPARPELLELGSIEVAPPRLAGGGRSP